MFCGVRGVGRMLLFEKPDLGVGERLIGTLDVTDRG